MAATRVYKEELYKKGHGWPLWEPDVGDVYLGDVGFFDQQSRFCRLFNVLVDRNDPLNARGVPDAFQPLQVYGGDVIFNPRAWTVGQCLSTSSVTSSGVDFKPLTSEIVPVSAGVTYNCSSNLGALLILRGQCIRLDLRENTKVETYIANYLDSWQALARKWEYGKKADELVLVRGCDKSDSWALAAFAERAKDASISFNGGLYQGVGGIELRGSWKSHDVSSAEYRDGSVIGTNYIRTGRVKIGPASAIWTALSLDGSLKPLRDCTDCLFVRVYKARRRKWRGLHIEAQAGPHQLPPRAPDDSAISPLASGSNMYEMINDVEIAVDPPLDMSSHPIDSLLDYLLEANPQAPLAIASDDDLYNITTDENYTFNKEMQPDSIIIDDCTTPFVCLAPFDPAGSPMDEEGAHVIRNESRGIEALLPMDGNSDIPKMRSGAPAQPQDPHASTEFQAENRNMIVNNPPTGGSEVKKLHQPFPPPLDTVDDIDALQNWLDENLGHPERQSQIQRLIDCVFQYNTDDLPRSLFVTNLAFEKGQHPVAFGTFSDVYRGTYMGTPVAIKCLRLISRAGLEPAYDKLYKSVLREVLIWRQLRHPRILPVLGLDYDTYRNRDSIRVVSPWMSQGTLMDYLQAQAQNFTGHQSLIIDVASGLAYLHGQSFIHGDLHGSHVYIDDSNRALLGGFGCTRFDDVDYSAEDTIAGAIRWLSPELLPQDDGLRKKTMSGDVFAFGRICLSIYTRKAPFHTTGPDFLVLFKVLAHQQPPRPSEDECYGASIPDELWDLITRCWDANPDARPSIASIEDQLSMIRF